MRIFHSTALRGKAKLRERPVSAEMGPRVDDKHVQESHFCNSCSSQKETNTIFRCSGCKARWYCSKACQTTDWEIHKPLCNTIQTLATKYEEADLGWGDGDDPHAFKTHLTPKQQDKLIKLCRYQFDWLPSPGHPGAFAP